jgi:hypothetical protein
MSHEDPLAFVLYTEMAVPFILQCIGEKERGWTESWKYRDGVGLAKRYGRILNFRCIYSRYSNPKRTFRIHN